MVEIGGTVGDIESLPFLEAIRQMGVEQGKRNSMFVHLTLVPYLKAAGELKTKPTQHSVKELRSIGIQPDVLLCRSEFEVPEHERKKIALFTNVAEKAVINMVDLDNIYKIPEVLGNEGFDDIVIEQFGLKCGEADLDEWRRVIKAEESATKIINVAMVGKYLDHSDAYKSLNEAMRHAGIPNNVKVNIQNIDSESLESPAGLEHLSECDAILVPGGFGDRGFEGKIAAAHYARVNKVPYLGICYGMHAVVIEYARNVCGLEGANTTENNLQTPHPVIALITQWQDHLGQLETRDLDSDLGGTMRLGAQKSVLKKGSLVNKVYGSDVIVERHRHRYEFNNAYRESLENCGLHLSATSEDGELIEMVELPQSEHPWYVACQFHPEFTSTPRDGHPLFANFIKAAIENK